MAMYWKQELSVGIQELDDQHREWIYRAGSLVSSIAQGHGRDEVTDLISSLEACVVEHFAREEELMASSGCPDIAQHRQAHGAFLRAFSDMKSKLGVSAATVSLATAVQHQVYDWLIGHINQMDKAVGACLAGAGQEQEWRAAA